MIRSPLPQIIYKLISLRNLPLYCVENVRSITTLGLFSLSMAGCIIDLSISGGSDTDKLLIKKIRYPVLIGTPRTYWKWVCNQPGTDYTGIIITGSRGVSSALDGRQTKRRTFEHITLHLPPRRRSRFKRYQSYYFHFR